MDNIICDILTKPFSKNKKSGFYKKINSIRLGKCNFELITKDLKFLSPKKKTTNIKVLNLNKSKNIDNNLF